MVKRVARPTSDLMTALGYTRVSKTEMAKEGLSLPAQLAATRRYAAGHGWAIGAEFEDVMTGRRDDRPQYQALLAECRRLAAEGQRVAVVVCWLHRLGRDLAESVKARRELADLGVAIHSVNEGGEVSDFLANIMASVAQYESEQIGERIKQVNSHSRANGWRVPGRCPWGYRWRERTPQEQSQGAPAKVLDADPTQRTWVAQAFQRVAGGESVRSVAEWVAGLPDAARGGRALNYSRVRLALRSPVYKGESEPAADEDGEEQPGHPGRWPALVDAETWAMVQAKIEGRPSLPHQASGRYLLTGLLRCPSCGSRMAGRRYALDAGRGRNPRYMCISAMIGATARRAAERDTPGYKACTTTALMASVDASLLRQLAPVVAVAGWVGHPTLQPALRRAWAGLTAPDDAARKEQHRLDVRRRVAKQQLGEAGKRLLDGTFDKDTYDATMASIKRDLAQIERRAAELAARGAGAGSDLPPLEDALATVGGWATAVARFDVASQRDILAVLVERIVPRKVGYGRYEVDITWTATGAALQQAASVMKAGAAGDEPS